MPACDPQTFLNITAERFACIVKQAEESSGLLLEGASGEAKAKGIHIQWEFDALAETLTIVCLEKPFFAPCGLIAAQVEQLVNNCA